MLILFPFACYHVCWCMQTCNMYMDSTINFYFLFYRDSYHMTGNIQSRRIAPKDAACGRCRGITGVGRQTNQNKCRTKKCLYFVLFSHRRQINTTSFAWFARLDDAHSFPSCAKSANLNDK